MPRTINDIVTLMLGQKDIQIATLAAENEALAEKVKALEAERDKTKTQTDETAR
jgi:cell division protein FtsB